MAKKTTDLDAGVVAAVLDEISKERRKAHEDLKGREKALQDAVDDLNDKGRPAGNAKIEADADLKAHARFEGKMPKQTYDARLRELTKAAEDAAAKWKRVQRDAQDIIAPLQEAVNKQLESCRELAREWNAHLRLAKASGVDVAAYWTPEAKVQ